jgi:hypothetical protein
LTARILDDPQNPAPRLELARWYVRVGALGSASVQYEEMIARGLDVHTAQRELRALEQANADALPR